MAEPILTVEHLIKAYGETPVLDDISFAVKPGEVIAVCEKSRSTNRFKMLNEGSAVHSTPKWIEKAGTFEGKIIAKPVRDDIDFDVAEHLIVELYSK